RRQLVDLRRGDVAFGLVRLRLRGVARGARRLGVQRVSGRDGERPALRGRFQRDPGQHDRLLLDLRRLARRRRRRTGRRRRLRRRAAGAASSWMANLVTPAPLSRSSRCVTVPWVAFLSAPTIACTSSPLSRALRTAATRPASSVSAPFRYAFPSLVTTSAKVLLTVSPPCAARGSSTSMVCFTM